MKKLYWTGAALAAGLTVAIAADKPQFGTFGLDTTAMDLSVKPGDDFYDYANGAWQKKAVIPPERTGAGSFDDLQITSENRMKAIVADLEAKPQVKGEEKQLKDLYDAFTDTKQIEANGLKPFRKDIDYLTGLKTHEDVARAMGAVDRETDSLFADGIIPNPKDTNSYIVTIAQSGLGLPDRDYYLRDDKTLAATRDAYRKYLATMLNLAGVADAQARADAVFALETNIAKAHWAAADRRVAEKVYNPMTIAQLESMAPGFPFGAYFGAQGLTPSGPKGARIIVVRENTAFPAMAKVFADTPVSVWRDYMLVHYLHNVADYLPAAFDDADFAFFGKTILGKEKQLDRGARGVHLLDARLGHPLGKLYVARYFPPASKAKVEKLVSNLLKAYDADIRKISWMTPVTRQKALDKLHAFTPHVGYPDKWRDYSGLRIERNDLIGDIERSSAFEWNYRLARIDQAVDRNEWSMTPPTINAYYTPLFNSIFFPAAILQAPFFDPNADDAVNYGGIGVVMGHEIGHGFDDQGSKYTGAGILESWWTDDDRKAFEERTSALGSQYDAFEGLPGLHVQGKLTMGENIGDLSGLTIALQAYHFSLNGKKAKMLDGFTGDQRYFLGFAQVWRAKWTDGVLRSRLLSNPHSPPHWRAVGPARNVDEWYAAFDVKPGDKMYLPPDKRVHIW